MDPLEVVLVGHRVDHPVDALVGHLVDVPADQPVEDAPAGHPIAIRMDLHNRDQLLVVHLNQHNSLLPLLLHPNTKPNQPLHHSIKPNQLLHHSIKPNQPLPLSINPNKQLLRPNIKLSMQQLQPVLHNQLLNHQLLVWTQPKLLNNSNNTCSITSKLWHIGNSIKRLEGNQVQHPLLLNSVLILGFKG